MAMMDERDYGDLLIGGIEKAEIHIVDSDPAWASQFLYETGDWSGDQALPFFVVYLPFLATA